MFDQLFGAFLFLVGLSGSVRGESTASATTLSSVLSHEVFHGLEKKFLERKQHQLAVWESKRASTTAMLATFGSEKKKLLTETVQERLNEFNKKQCELFMRTLKRLSLAVEKIKESADIYAKENGKDMSAVISSLHTASQAITKAVDLVTSHVGKTYDMDVTSEEKVKAHYDEKRKQLAADLKKVRDAVHEARKKVQEAWNLYKKTTGTSLPMMIYEDGAELLEIQPTNVSTPSSISL